MNATLKTSPDASLRSPVVALVSGGLDSAVATAIARNDGHDVIALTFDYGQRHRIELEAARRVSVSLGVARQIVAHLDLDLVGGSALTDEIDVPKNRPLIDSEAEIPITYVPARNLIFLSYAVALAEVHQASQIVLGVNAVDYSGYPDCRPGFIEAFQRCAAMATRVGVEGNAVRVTAPLMEMNKSQIIRRGLDLGVDFSLTHSCYDPDESGLACGYCDACLLRKQGFASAGAPDPTRYVAGVS